MCPIMKGGHEGTERGGDSEQGEAVGSYQPPPLPCSPQQDLKTPNCLWRDENGKYWTYVGGDIDFQAYDGKPPANAPPTLSPAQAAQIAAARLKMHPVGVGLGPDPSLNSYEMIPVGFPIWLWAEGGDTATKSSTASVAGITVALTAHLTGITWDMGDGHRFTCGVGTPYVRGALPPATPSPDCGHTYTKMGHYTITATTRWAIDWRAGTQSGTIPFAMSQTREIPIGELQVLVR
ncbi:hypothetical protein GCM10009841_33880 [Microlunatus panaciterrae]|uniref:hypothetical protein n=1 Tax=Microlunatus panaciterrae TaxID=400768 RepID=UPI0031D247B7